MKNNFKSLQDRLSICFENDKYLRQAFTHSSYVNENKKNRLQDNERLEFLGDAVLELTVSDYLFKSFPNIAEGELTKLRSAIVCESSLVELAESLNFGDYILLGKGEELSGGRQRPALLEDVFESFIGALYLDKGIESVRDFLDRFVFPKIDNGFYNQKQDYKSKLQEHIQQNSSADIIYQIVDEQGPAHDVEFRTEVIVDNKVLGKGSGKSKKESEQKAARQALEKLGV